MLNRERIRLMTQMAAYEDNEGKHDIATNGYFRGDYISFQLLKSAIYATASFVMAVAMYVLYDLENFLEDFYKMDIMEFIHGILNKYVLVLAIYMVISYFVYAYRYSKAKRSIRRYQTQLKQLSQMYNRGSSNRRR